MNNLIWSVAVLLFAGIWAETTLNLGYVGLMLGWVPGLVVAYVFLHLTERMKVKEGIG